MPQSGGAISAICARFRSTHSMPRCCAFPTRPKIELLDYLLEHGKHALVEKPLVADDEAALARLAAGRARQARRRALHRLQSPLRAAFRAHARPRRVGRARRDLSLPHVLRQRHGAAGAQFGLARPGRRRADDLGSHLLDTARFWFGDIGDEFSIVSADRFENRSPDHVVFAAPRGARRSSNSR